MFRNIHKKTHVLKSLLNKIYWKEIPTQTFSCKYLEISKKSIWRTSVFACCWRDFRKWLIRTFFLESCFRNHPSITKIPVPFKPEPSLHLTPTLFFELRFPMYIINGYDGKANACSPWTSCLPYSASSKNL